ncbi:MAG: helix-turn-helix domain-containing protein [Corynebacterium sp.]|nr:helix-turn-helix domain-containing protein [Corynebacterium sp.]
MPRLDSRDLAQRRQEILAGARRCFALYGYEGATVRRLEEVIGKSRGAIFHHFGDKQNLFLTLARQDSERMAEVVAEHGLIDVMRSFLDQPDQYEWLVTRLEISRLLRTDTTFAQQWHDHQAILDEAIITRLGAKNNSGYSTQTMQVYLETVLDGFISRLAQGESKEKLHAMLDVVEQTIRG